VKSKLQKIRFAAEARGNYRKEFIDEVVQGCEILEIGLHFGDKNSHYDVTGLVRNKHLPGKLGYLLDIRSIDRCNLNELKAAPYDAYFEIFSDQLRRNSQDFVRRGHRLNTSTDYYAFYQVLCQKFEDKLLESKINAVIFFEIPHLAIDYALYVVSKRLGISTLILSQKVPDRIFSMWNMEDFGNLQFDIHIPRTMETQNNDVSLFYMDARWQEKSPRGQFKLLDISRLLGKIVNREPKLLVSPINLFDVIKRVNKVKQTLPHWRDFMKFDYSEAQLKYFEQLCKFEGSEPDLKSNFVYVPLHLQPEMTTSSLGGKFVDQALLIEKLSNILPKTWKIYVKENPKQSCYDRTSSFFERIGALPNVSWVPADTNTNALSVKAKVVATVSGVAGWEAIKLGTPTIIFGVTWYASMPGVFQYHDHIDIEKIAAFQINKEDLEKSISYLFSKAHEGNIDKMYFKQVENFDKNMNAQKVGKLIREILLGTQKTTFSRIE